MSETPPPGAWSWTRRNLTAIALLTAMLIALAVWRLATNRARLREDLTVEPAAVAPAAEKIDPNTASWASLARLPGIGPGRAKAICTWREAFCDEHPGQPAFRRPADLEQVPGVGPVIVQSVAPYLTFPQEAGGGS